MILQTHTPFGQQCVELPEHDPSGARPTPQRVTRAPKPIILNPVESLDIDGGTIAFEFYNCFNYSLLPKRKNNVRLTMGITSANPGEGKTHVAANLAVSLSLGYQKKTVLVDLNIRRPRLHQIFRAPLAPGLVDALHQGSIHLSSTAVDHLALLSAGASEPGEKKVHSRRSSRVQPDPLNPHIDLDDTAAFGDIITSLEQESDFVIVDMPPILSRDFPILFSGLLDGLLVVVEYNRTKRGDLEKLFRLLHERQVLGFVFNNVSDDDL